MSEAETAPALSMREMSARSGVSEGTLRIWESRYGFPAPERLPSGHRRYSELELSRVRAVLDARSHGLSLATAIERARRLGASQRPSVFARLRERFPYMHPQLLPKRALIALSHAIEDESSARGERPLLIGCFQRERFYRSAEPRWRQMAQTAERAVVLADFARSRRPRGAPAEVGLRESDPLMREWVLVCEAPSFGACLAAFEHPRPTGGERCFETVWSAERDVVREAAEVCCQLISARAPALGEELAGRLADPLPPARDELRGVTELTTRMVLYAVSGQPPLSHAAARAAP